jgi:dienelactone hydrolase
MRASFSRFTVLSVLVGLQFWGSVGNPALAQQAIPPAAPVGEVKGSELAHTAASAQRLMADAALALPAAQAGGAVFFGKLAAAPAVSPVPGNLPVVVFLHGSSGLGLKAIEEWQRWLAGLGIASIAPDSFALPNRITYKSPVDVDTYERIHALRLSEVMLALQAVQQLPWVDKSRVVLAGTSEGATAVARYSGGGFAARVIYSWSCENNYFVRDHATHSAMPEPVLNVMSASDPFFSKANPWLASATAAGHCAAAFKDHKAAQIVLIPGAPHTLLNLPQSRQATQAFLQPLLLKPLVAAR